MFEKYLKRVEPKDAGGQVLGLPATTPSGSTHDLGGVGGGGARLGRKRSKSRSSTLERALRLTAEQKCDIAQREIEEYREEVEKFREESEKTMDHLKVIIAFIITIQDFTNVLTNIFSSNKTCG